MEKKVLPSEDTNQIWKHACKTLKSQLSPAVFNTWIVTNPLSEIYYDENDQAFGLIETPSDFHATNLKKNLSDKITKAIEDILQAKIVLKFAVKAPVDNISQQAIQLNNQVANPTNFVSVSPETTLLPAAEMRQTQTATSYQPVVKPFTPSLFSSPRPIQATENIFNQANSLFSQNTIQASIADRAITAAKRIGLRIDYTFESFAVSTSNEMAHAAANAVSNRPGQAYNPLFFYGGVGVGKTHLMQAIGNNILKKNPSSNVIYCTGEEFTNEIINAIQTKKAIGFKEKYRNAQILLIDDIQFIAGKNAVQEEFFHTFNALIKNSSQIVLTSDRPPSEINLLEDRLRSRFEAGLMIDIQQPSLELRTAIVLIKAQNTGVELPMLLAKLIALKVNSARKIEGVITSIRSEVELKGRQINEALIEELIGKEITQVKTNFRIKPQEIIKEVADFYKLKPLLIRGTKRNKEIAMARHIAMYILKNDLKLSYVEIGKWFSNRDHTSVMHATRKIDKLIKTDSNIQDELRKIKVSFRL